MVIGENAGGFFTPRYLNLGGTAHHHELLPTLAYAMGRTDLSSFGDSGTRVIGALSGRRRGPGSSASRAQVRDEDDASSRDQSGQFGPALAPVWCLSASRNPEQTQSLCVACRAHKSGR